MSDKRKRSDEWQPNWWQSILLFPIALIANIFFDDYGISPLGMLILMLGFALLMTFLITLGVRSIDTIDLYEEKYSECIARETLTQAQCHDIALEWAN